VPFFVKYLSFPWSEYCKTSLAVHFHFRKTNKGGITMRIDSIMTRDVVWVNPKDRLADGYELMREFSVRHLPVVSDMIPVGVISERDLLLEAQVSEDQVILPDMEVESVMSTDVITCSPKCRVADVAATMIECKIGSVLVVDDNGTLLGIVTSSDLLDLLRTKEQQTTRQVIPFVGRQESRSPMKADQIIMMGS